MTTRLDSQIIYILIINFSVIKSSFNCYNQRNFEYFIIAKKIRKVTTIYFAILVKLTKKYLSSKSW